MAGKAKWRVHESERMAVHLDFSTKPHGAWELTYFFVNKNCTRTAVAEIITFVVVTLLFFTY